MLEDPKTKVAYDTDGIQTVFPIDMPFDYEEEIHAWIRDKTTKLQDPLVNPDDFFIEEKNLITTAVWAGGYRLVIKRVVTIKQILELLYGGPLPSGAVEKALDYQAKVSLQQEEKHSRSLLLPETTEIENLELPEPEEGFYLRYLSGVLTWVQAFSGNQTMQPFMKVFIESLTAAIARSNIGAAGNVGELSDTDITDPAELDLLQLLEGKWKDQSLMEIFGSLEDGNPWRHNKYTDANAVTAMGAKADDNPLHHDRYTIPVGTPQLCFKDNPPSGFLECDGKTLGKTGSGADYAGDTYKALYDFFGDDYGGTYNWDNGDVVNLPDSCGLFPRFWDHGAGVDPDAASRTDRGDGTTGDHVGTKQADQFKSHRHRVKSCANANGNYIYGMGSSTAKSGLGGGGWSTAGAWYDTDYAGHQLIENSGGTETRGKNIYLMLSVKY